MGNEDWNLPGWYPSGGRWPWLGALECMTNVKVGRYAKARELFLALTDMNLQADGLGKGFMEHFGPNGRLTQQHGG